MDEWEENSALGAAVEEVGVTVGVLSLVDGEAACGMAAPSGDRSEIGRGRPMGGEESDRLPAGLDCSHHRQPHLASPAHYSKAVRHQPTTVARALASHRPSAWLSTSGLLCAALPRPAPVR